MKRRHALALAAFGTLPLPAPAADISRQPTTIYVPFAPGGPTDQMARVIGEALTTLTSQTVIVENRPGAGGQIAAAAVKQSPPASLPLFIGDMAALGSNVALYRAFSYDPIKDFQPITTLLSFPMVLYVRGDSPISSVPDLIARSRREEMSYASQGIGTAGHLLGAMLKRQHKAGVEHVPYKGSAPAMQGLMSGQVGLLFDGLPAGLQYVQAGRLKAIAIMADHRSPLLPGVPTAAEAGIPDMEMDVWFGIVAGLNVPKTAVQKLNSDFVEILKSPKITSRFEAQGYEVVPRTPEQFAAYMRTELDRWRQVITANQIALD